MCGHENKAYLEFSFSLLMDRLIVRTQNVFFGVRGCTEERSVKMMGKKCQSCLALSSWFEFVGICKVTGLLRWLDAQGRDKVSL